MKKFHKSQFISLLFLYFFVLPIFINSNGVNLQIGREGTKDEISLEVKDGTLTLKGEKKLEKDQVALREDCRSTLKYIDQTIENVRRVSRDLSPSILEDLGLTASL